MATIDGWKDFSQWLTAYEVSHQRSVVPTSNEENEAFVAEYIQSLVSLKKSSFGEEGATSITNDAYLEGRDRDEDDLSLPDDVDLVRTLDLADKYRINLTMRTITISIRPKFY